MFEQTPWAKCRDIGIVKLKSVQSLSPAIEALTLDSFTGAFKITSRVKGMSHEWLLRVLLRPKVLQNAKSRSKNLLSRMNRL